YVVRCHDGHGRMRGAHLSAFKWLIVDENEGIDADVDRLRDTAQRVAFRPPTDLREQHVTSKTEMSERSPCRFGVVFRGNRIQDAARVEHFDCFGSLRI